MRSLTKKEILLLENRRTGFEKFLNERLPVLTEFFTDMGYSEPHQVLVKPSMFLDDLDQYLANQVINDDLKNWILVRIGYYLGEYFIEKCGACWLLNENPNTSSFARYVVGDFSKKYKKDTVIDTFEMATVYVNDSARRSLKNYINEVMIQIMTPSH